MSPQRRQDRNAFLVFLALVPLALLVAPLPYLRVASENYAANQRIQKHELARQRASEAPTAAGASAVPARGAEAAER